MSQHPWMDEGFTLTFNLAENELSDKKSSQSFAGKL
jgi:hypothetical protein